MMPWKNGGKTVTLDKDPTSEEEMLIFSSPEERMQQRSFIQERALRAADLGWLGRFIGGERHSALNLAAFFLAVSLLIGVGCLVAAWCQNDQSEFWGRSAERSFAAAAAALAYVFGQS
ncbi:hypothetical protein [Methylobacterium sp. Leaf91]|uniref:hypothetical protein n=1 Tax=Methylobacterium sp. Leaf91 TaxID=1736247 RepID=UPI000700054A|nr:hypothetical protein [Methylobacterium sp. Leaf91]KQO99079.1 hypothetical protein ASF32_14590 [Methylobacterium sp. Leaf91]